MNKKIISVFLSVIMLITVFSASAVVTFADTDQNLYVKQMQSGRCTLASVVMVMRSKALMEGNQDWSNISQQSSQDAAWILGTGLRHSFTYCGIKVSYKDLESDDNKAELLDLLETYPEGISIYERSLPHAVFLTRYDKGSDTFYCADPALSTSEMKLEDSWLSRISSDATQEDIVDALDCYWYVASYKSMEIPEYVAPSTDKPSDDSSDSTASENTSNNTSGNSSDNTSNSTTGTSDINQAGSTGVLEGNNQIAIEVPSQNQNTSQNTTVTVKFDKVKSYSATDFKDVDSSAWYMSYIKEAYEMGLMTGISNKEFSVNGNITLAQSITLSARIYSSYMNDGYSFTPAKGEIWYDPYVQYAYNHGIITSKYVSGINLDEEASRLQFAEIVAGSLPEKALVIINNVYNGDISDVSESGTAGKAVYKLYRAGVLTGSDDGTFLPDNSITRAEVSAIVARIANSSLRVVA